MTNTLDKIYIQHRNKTVILDTNILLVYLTGRVDPKLIETFKRTNGYCIEDFYVLKELIEKFKKFSTTPNILTEVSNLGGQLSGDRRDNFFKCLSNFIQATGEKYLQSSQVSQNEYFAKYGITDTGLFELVKTSNYLVITHDFRLSGNFPNYSVNLNHLRTEYLLRK